MTTKTELITFPFRSSSYLPGSPEKPSEREMNYKHEYHAGNFAEVFKHVVLVLLLDHLRRKSTPFMVLDTHAGAGLYDLRSEKAQKTYEARKGIERIIGARFELGQSYIDLIRRLNQRELALYPGSPIIIQSFLRQQDRLIACELQQKTAAELKARFQGDRRVSIHHRNGYQALAAFLPPSERRGLVFMDPPFEVKSEFEELCQSLAIAQRKWPTGIFSAWYPIKNLSKTLAFKQDLSSAKLLNCLIAEFVPFPIDGVRLAGSGIVICNPPWQLAEKIKRVGSELLTAFDAGGGNCLVQWLTCDE